LVLVFSFCSITVDYSYGFPDIPDLLYSCIARTFISLSISKATDATVKKGSSTLVESLADVSK